MDRLTGIFGVSGRVDAVGSNDLPGGIRPEEDIVILAFDFDIGFVSDYDIS